MKYETLLISDLDETLQKARKPLSDSQIRIIERIIEKRTFLSIISGASVQNIETRFISRINPMLLKSIVFYANNGAVCFQVSKNRSYRYIYDHSKEFKKYREEILEIVSDYFTNKLRERIKFVKKGAASKDVICIDQDKESQITIILKGREEMRKEIVSELSSVLTDKYHRRIAIFSAGKKSIDILLSETNKRSAVRHLIKTYKKESFFVLNRKVIIAGDSFHEKGPDLQLLHPFLKGATVFCAGDSIPQTTSFFVIQAAKPSYVETYKFLKKEFNL